MLNARWQQVQVNIKSVILKPLMSERRKDNFEKAVDYLYFLGPLSDHICEGVAFEIMVINVALLNPFVIHEGFVTA